MRGTSMRRRNGDDVRVAREIRNAVQPIAGDVLLGVSYLPGVGIYVVHLAPEARIHRSLLSAVELEAQRQRQRHDARHVRVSTFGMPDKTKYFVSAKSGAAAIGYVDRAAEVAANAISSSHLALTLAADVAWLMGETTRSFALERNWMSVPGFDVRQFHDRVLGILTERHGFPESEFDASFVNAGSFEYYDYLRWGDMFATRFEREASVTVWFGDRFIGQSEAETDEPMASKAGIRVNALRHGGKVLYAFLSDVWPNRDGSTRPVAFKSVRTLQDHVAAMADEFDDLPIPPDGTPGWPGLTSANRARRRR